MPELSAFLEKRHSVILIDVRSETEFAQGHIPGAFNIPILNNEERAIVGTTYKKFGSNQSILAGIQLTWPRFNTMIKQVQKLAGHKEVIVYCWRGGMRSQYFCWLAKQAGIGVSTITGGYKEYRKWVLDQFDKKYSITLLTGYTGSGKTEILNLLKLKQKQVVCLESLANHKGSVFGGIDKTKQPTTEQFENNFAELLSTFQIDEEVWMEDEAIGIGNIFIPLPIWRNMRASKLIKVEVSKAERVKRLVQEYGQANPLALKSAIQLIEKKLGGQHAKAAMLAIDENNLKEAADIILVYYDRYYDKSINNRILTKTINWSWEEKELSLQKLIQVT